MSVYYQSYMLTLCQSDELACAGAYSLQIHIEGTFLAIVGIQARLEGNSINCQQDRSGLWQAYQDRLMSGHMPAGLDQFDARQKLCITIHLAIVQLWRIPVLAIRRKALKPRFCQLIMLALHHQLSSGKDFMIACMVHIKVCGDQVMDIARLET